MCKDASLTYLNELGYNVVRYPRADILPLDILGRQRGTLTSLGRLPDLVLPGAGAPPALRSNVHAANLESRRSSKLDAKAAVSVLGPYLKALGGAAEASASFRRCKSLQFVFAGVLIDDAAPAEVGAFLGRCQIDEHNPLWRPYLRGEGELFVITETLKSRTLTVAADASSQADLAIDTGALQSAVGGRVGVSGGGTASSLISFDGSEPLIFGFKCLRLQVADGQLALLNAPPSAALAFSPPGQKQDAAQEGDLLGEGLLRVRPSRRRDATASRRAVPDAAPLPEEDSPYTTAGDGGALLYLRLLDADWRPRGGVACRVRGPVGDRPDRAGFTTDFATGPALDTESTSDAEGVLLLDGCPAGRYELHCGGAAVQVHTLRQADLTADSEPYRIVLAPPTEVQS